MYWEDNTSGSRSVHTIPNSPWIWLKVEDGEHLVETKLTAGQAEFLADALIRAAAIRRSNAS